MTLTIVFLAADQRCHCSPLSLQGAPEDLLYNSGAAWECWPHGLRKKLFPGTVCETVSTCPCPGEDLHRQLSVVVAHMFVPTGNESAYQVQARQATIECLAFSHIGSSASHGPYQGLQFDV